MPEITIDKSLVSEENEKAVKTRVPYTRVFLWISKDNMKEIYDGKTILTSLDEDKNYMLYDNAGNVFATITGKELYENHYDPVNRNKDNHKKGQKAESSKQLLGTQLEAEIEETEPEQEADVLQEPLLTEAEKADKATTNTLKISVPIVASIYDKCQFKIAKLEDKNTKLQEKQAKLEDSITKKTEFVSFVTQVENAVPKPVAVVLHMLASEKQQKIESLSKKLSKCNDKINSNKREIIKNENRASVCEKINTFLNNMKSPEGRRENFISTINEFRKISLRSATEKLDTVKRKLFIIGEAYDKTPYATEKIKLQKKLDKLVAKGEKLEKKIADLEALDEKFASINNMSNEDINSLIDKSCEGVVSELENNPKASKNPAQAVVTACNDVLNNEILSKRQRLENKIANMEKEADKYYDLYGHDNWSLSRDIDTAKAELAKLERKESENHLAGAEMSEEGNYNMIDGIINNAKPEKNQDRAVKEQKHEKSKSPLSRNQLKQNAQKIAHKEPEHNVNNKAHDKGQAL